MKSNEFTKKKDWRYSNKYLDFFEFCLNDNEDFYDWERSNDFTQSNKNKWDNSDFLSINGRRL